MKVWLMNHYATSAVRDRAGRHYWFAKELKKRGYDVSIFCASTFLDNLDEIDTGGKKLAVKRDSGVTSVYVKTVPNAGNGVDRIRNMCGFYRNLKPAVSAYAAEYGRPDVIVASSVHPLTMVAGIQIAKRWKIPCICEIRDLWPEAIFCFGKAKEKSVFGKVLIAGEHWIYRNADALIFTKEGDMDYLKEKKWTTEQGGDIDLDKCYYINNGVDIKDYTRRIRKEKIEDEDLCNGKFHVIYAGVIRPVNNVGKLLDCAKILKKRGYDDIQILIYGNGSEYESLCDRVLDERIENVKMKGFVERRFIPYILSKSSVNVLNYSQSQYNWSRGNSSNKLFEYMASGKPVLSTVRMGYSIIEKYQCGIELGSDDPKELADAIIRFYEMPTDEYDRMAVCAGKGAEDFDFKELTDKLEAVIESVI